MGNDDFFSLYFKYLEETECPTFYHRWCALSGVGTMLGRTCNFKLGHSSIHPNMYVMLIGTPGTRKSTAIKIIKKVMSNAGYTTMSADRTSKEKFLLDLHEQVEGEATADDILDQNLWGDSDRSNFESRAPAELYIAADEFNDFIGNGNIEFISLLGSLWDFNGVFENKIKNGKSVIIPNPTINILGGNTPTGFALAFPTDVLGQGFFSRLLLIYGEPTGKKITFPKAPDPEIEKELAYKLREMKIKSAGEITLNPLAAKLLDKIYKNWENLDDVRFEHYSNRRFTHLLKLCIIYCAARMSTIINERDVIIANTILSHTEHLMPKALGEFGKSRYSDVTHKIMTLLEKATRPITPKEIMIAVHSDVDSPAVVAELIKGLQHVDKIMQVNGGFLAKKKVRKELDSDIFDASILSDEELSY